MRILVLGATGLIGSAVVAAARAAGHVVVGLARHPANATGVVTADLSTLTTARSWQPYLGDVDAVVNCVGILQDAPGEDTGLVHVEAVAALCEACRLAKVGKLIHFSAMGTDRETPSPFSKSKRSGEEAVTASGLDWIVLRPSVVLGRQAFGGSAAIRGLAALPVLPELPDTAELQVVQLGDVVETVLFFLRPEAPSRVMIDLAGPERLTFTTVVKHYRSWLGWREARPLRLARWMANILYKAGDAAALLGWRPPLRTNARAELARGAISDSTDWHRITGIRPKSLAQALAEEPAGVQERWFAALYFLKPVIFVVLSLFWIATAFTSLGPGYGIGIDLMREGGAGALAGPSVVAGALADLAIGIGIAFRRTARPALWAGIALALFYAAAGSLLLPRLWSEPLGPLLKIWPIIALMAVALAILRSR